MIANGWVKFDFAKNKCLVRFYAVLGQWFMVIRRTLVCQYPSVNQWGWHRCVSSTRCKQQRVMADVCTKLMFIFKHFNSQLTHTTLQNVELLKHSKISKTAPTCFILQGNHLQGATVST